MTQTLHDEVDEWVFKEENTKFTDHFPNHVRARARVTQLSMKTTAAARMRETIHKYRDDEEYEVRTRKKLQPLSVEATIEVLVP